MSDILPFGAGESGDGPSLGVRGLLESARRRLGMDLTLLCQVVDGCEIYRPPAGRYCQGSVDTVGGAEAVVTPLAISSARRIGRYTAVPIHLPDGRLYGTLCELGPRADANLLEFLAELVASEIEREGRESRRLQELTARVTDLLDKRRFTMVFQPIVELRDGTVTGFEALARFAGRPARGPNAWFGEACEVGLGVELELLTLQAGLAALEQLQGSAFLSVNASAETVCSGGFADALAGVDLARVVLEITEHAAVANYEALACALRPLRSRGLRLAVDDVGAGVASLRHVIELAPELIKMDITLTRGIDSNPARSALATALVSFGTAIGASLIAEGIETSAELAAVADLGVGYGQGYLLGRPGPLGPLPG